jgi:hypothetical protein
LAQSNYSSFPAVKQNLEGSRFKNGCQVETFVPLRLILFYYIDAVTRAENKKLKICEYYFHCFTVHFNSHMCNGPNNALVCNKTLIQMSHIETLKITPTCFDHQLIIIRELFDPG